MEIKYTVSEKNDQNDISKLSMSHAHHGICRISCENVVAFTRVLFHSNAFNNSIPIYTVYVADLNTPYECHMVMESLVKITQIVFSNNGREMLIVTSLGYVHYYMKGSGLHQWENTHTSNWSGEEILLANFFHTENKPVIQMADVKVNSLYSEKFGCRPHKPTLFNIGNCPQNGFFAISASGLILVCILNSSGALEEEGKAVLGPVRDNFVLASASLSQSGHIHVAAWKPEIVKCWKVELSYSFKDEGPINVYHSCCRGGRKLKIGIQSAKSFSPSPSNTESNKDLSDKDIRVTHLQYVEQEDPTNLLILLEIDKMRVKQEQSEEKSEATSTTIPKADMEDVQCVYLLQRYQLQDKTKPLLKLFQQSVTSESTNNSTIVKEWACIGEWNSPHKITSVCTPSRQLCSGPQVPFVIVATTAVGGIHTFNRDYMMQINKFNLQSFRAEEMPPPKRLATDRHIVSCCPTWTSLHLVSLDSQGSLHMFSLLKQADIGSSWLVYIMLVLEYSLISDCDWLDILMSMPPTSVQTLVEKITETFNQHPAQIVNHLHTKFLIMKNSILRLFFNVHQKSIEVRLQAQLLGILKLFHSLRPVTTDVINQEKNLVDIIETFLESRNSLEILDLEKALDQILFSFNILDCQIDASLAQDLQTLLQFATDLSLYLLLLLVQNSKYGLVKDPKILLCLREIFFLARLWYRHNKLVVPQMIRKSDNVDVWPQLYKLLTRLAQIVPNEPDPPFIDECIVLETQVVCRELPLFIPPRGVLGCVAAPPSTTLPYPLQFSYNQSDPNSSVSSVNPRPLEGSLPAPHPFDPLFYHFLGTNGPVFQCTRCFAVRGSWWGVGDYISMWEQEWADRCVCSGYWAPSLTSATNSRTNT